MAVIAYVLAKANAWAGRPSGCNMRFICDTEAELPAEDAINGDWAYAKDTKKSFERTAGAWTQRDQYAGEGGGQGGVTLADVVDALYPVGALKFSANNVNPGTYLAGTTWAAWGPGRVLVGFDSGQTEFDTAEETGGAKTHQLTTNEMPSHTHVQDAHTHVQNAHTHTQDAHSHGQQIRNTGTAGTAGTQGGSAANNATAGTTATATAVNQSTTAVNQNATAVNQSTGGGQPHNNMPPYIVGFMFKRTA